MTAVPLAVGALVAVIAVVGVAAGCALPPRGSARPLPVEVPPADLLSFDRPGYPPNSSSVGDPAALVSAPGAGAVSYRGVPVVQACDLMPLDGLAGVGVSLLGGTSTGLVERNFFDGQGDADLPLIEDSLVAEDNTCFVILGRASERTGLRVQVHQPSYVGREAIVARLTDDLALRRVADVGEVVVFEPVRRSAETTERWFAHREVFVEVTISGALPEGPRQALLDLVVQRLPELAADPRGPGRFAYRSPVFPVEYVNACEISTAGDYRSLFGSEPSPSVRELVSPGVGVVGFFDGVTANYVSHSCRRHSRDQFLDMITLSVDVKTFDSVDGAVSQMAFERDFADGETDTPTRLGDDSLFLPYLEYDAVAFRAGNAVVYVWLSGPADVGSDVYAALFPIAAAIAERTPVGPA